MVCWEESEYGDCASVGSHAQCLACASAWYSCSDQEALERRLTHLGISVFSQKCAACVSSVRHEMGGSTLRGSLLVTAKCYCDQLLHTPPHSPHLGIAHTVAVMLPPVWALLEAHVACDGVQKVLLALAAACSCWHKLCVGDFFGFWQCMCCTCSRAGSQPGVSSLISAPPLLTALP